VPWKRSPGEPPQTAERIEGDRRSIRRQPFDSPPGVWHAAGRASD